MKTLFTILSYILKVVAAFVFASGIILAIFGAYHFVTVFQQLRGEDVVVGLMAISLLRTIVFFSSRHSLFCIFTRRSRAFHQQTGT